MLNVDQPVVGPIRGGGVENSAPATPVSNRADSVSKRTRFEVFKRDGFRCLYCGRIPPEVTLEIDHVIPTSKAGTSDIINLVTACKDCNGGKSNVPLSQVPNAHVQSIEERQEKLDQIRAIAEQARRDVEVQEELLSLVSDHWMTLEGEDPAELVVSVVLERSIRRFLKLLPFKEVLDAVDITFNRLPNRSDYDKHRFFCGVCWRKIEERKPNPREHFPSVAEVGTDAGLSDGKTPTSNPMNTPPRNRRYSTLLWVWPSPTCLRLQTESVSLRLRPRRSCA